METELFVHFAEIAGVFVGFGALISMRSAHVTDVHDVVYLEGVLGLGVWVVVCALLPIAVNRYGVHDRPLWLSCAVVALVLGAAFLYEALYVTALTAGVAFAGYTLLALTLGQTHDLDPGDQDRPGDHGVPRPSTK